MKKCIALALTFGLPLSAQVGLSLADAVNRGLASHFQLKAANAKVASAEGIRSQGVLRPNPRLFLQSENSRFGGTPPFSYSTDADTFVYGSLVVETGGKLQKRRQFLNEGVKRGELERDLTASQITYRISVAYWTALGADRNSQVLLNNLSNFQRIVDYHSARVREGAMAEADLLRVQLEYEKLALSLRSAEQEAWRSRILLFREMGVAGQLNVGELTEALDGLGGVPEDWAERSIEARADLQLARQVHVQAQRNIDLQRANAVPDPEILFGYKRTGGHNSMIAGVQINLPFRSRNQGLIAAARAEEQAADATLQATKLNAEADVAAARASYRGRLDLVTKTFPPLRAKAVESARIAEAAYREGGADLLRLLDAERTRIETDLLYYRALVDYQLAVVELKFALGVLR